MAVAALIEACFNQYPGCLFTWDEFPELRAPASWAAGRGTEFWVVDDTADSIAGCIAATPDGGTGVELHKFYVAAPLRGAGLAQMLATKVFACAERVKASNIFLWTDTRFTRAHRFYEKMGFARQPETRHLGDVSDTTEFLYTLDLSLARSSAGAS